MKILSLFDGISCGMLALQRAGIPVERYDAFEIDKYAITVSSNNFPDIVHLGNVFDGDFTKFKGYDLLIGGSPCTAWSIAKKGRETTADGEGFRIFMQYVRALLWYLFRLLLAGFQMMTSIAVNRKAQLVKAVLGSAWLLIMRLKASYFWQVLQLLQL